MKPPPTAITRLIEDLSGYDEIESMMMLFCENWRENKVSAFQFHIFSTYNCRSFLLFVVYDLTEANNDTFVIN